MENSLWGISPTHIYYYGFISIFYSDKPEIEQFIVYKKPF